MYKKKKKWLGALGHLLISTTTGLGHNKTETMFTNAPFYPIFETSVRDNRVHFPFTQLSLGVKRVVRMSLYNINPFDFLFWSYVYTKEATPSSYEGPFLNALKNQQF